MPEPISVVEARAHLRLDDDDQWEAQIADWIVEAREEVERRTGLILVQRMVAERLDGFRHADMVELAHRPVLDDADITLTCIGTDGATITPAVRLIPSSLEGSVSLALVLAPCGARWPRTARTRAAVTIVYQAGFASPAMIPATLKAAIKLLVGNKMIMREGAVMSGSAGAASYASTEVIETLLRLHSLPTVA